MTPLPPKSSSYRSINRQVGRAIGRYGMIANGDRILVAMSGGKDSLTLMWTLSERLQRVPVDYQLHAVYIDPGFDGSFGEDLAVYCRQAGYRFRWERTDHGPRAHGPENRENPCFLCSWNRRKRIFEIAEQLGCNKVAFGHHKDDIIETLFLNICYAGEISTMKPVQPFFKGLFTVIRPLALVEEDLIRRFARQQNFPRFRNPCPSASGSKRSDIKNLLDGLYKTNKKIRGNIFRAIRHVNPEYLFT
ncbi:MAG: adenine nucleotide alpha hydrolase [Deltaproteobacteria bacterium SG8_13]|nr:MAG: adenine nucleotide alpha hydrolase [Deltaproteobacteria bacterium SG8_13]